MLAHAVHEQDVLIDYIAASSSLSHRTSDAELIGGSLAAWWHLRRDDRHFAVGRSRSVRAAG